MLCSNTEIVNEIEDGGVCSHPIVEHLSVFNNNTLEKHAYEFSKLFPEFFPSLRLFRIVVAKLDEDFTILHFKIFTMKFKR